MQALTYIEHGKFGLTEKEKPVFERFTRRNRAHHTQFHLHQ